MKITNTTITIVLLIVTIISVNHFNNSRIEKLQDRNINNAKKIEIGMIYSDVFDIMEDTNVPCIKPFDYCDNVLLYNSFNDSFPYIEVSFDKNQKVKEIYIPKF